jgi:formylglycine-generating enzyme required for sulfatase activity
MRIAAILLLLAPDSSGTGRPKSIVLTLGEKAIRMEFVAVGPGRFVMGEGSEARPVVLSRVFWIQTTEVTQEQWEAVMQTNPSQHVGPRRPVDHVTWTLAGEFIARLKPLARGNEPALPTEAEWEFACRAGSTTRWHFGDDPARLEEYAWFGLGPKDHGSFDVATKKPNAWGLYDMCGNVLEWCADVVPGEQRVVRGGGWYGPAQHTESAWRYLYSPDQTGQTLGLRVVLR